MKQFDVAIAGEINLDLILSGLPAEMPLERELLATGFEYTLGSSSAILAHNLAVLGTSVGFITKVGSDPLGELALNLMRREGVDLSRTLRSKSGTGITVLLTHEKNKRHILTSLGAMSELRVAELDFEYLKSARHFHLSSLFLQTGLHAGLPELFRKLKQAGLTLSLDTNDDPEDRWQSGLRELLGLVDVVLPNLDEACRMTGTSTLKDAADALAERVPLVAIKCGAQGAWVQQGSVGEMIAPLPVKPIDTIGAGDSFNAGFLHAYLAGKSPAECARYGNRTAALSTQRPGGTTAFRDEALCREFLAGQ